MSNEPAITIIEVISEKIMLLEANDLVELGSVHGQLEELLGHTDEAPEEAGKLIASSASLLESVIMRETDNTQDTMDLFRRCVAAIQAMIAEHHTPGDALKDPEVAQLVKGEADASSSVEVVSEDTEQVAASETSAVDAENETKTSDSPTGEPEPSLTEQRDMMLETDADLLAEFVNEGGEHLDAVEGQLLIIEKSPEDDEAINALFRAFHTIKGIAGFLNLQQIGALSHEAETLLDKARRHELKLNSDILDVIFETRDKLGEMIHHVEDAIAAGGAYQAVSGVDELVNRIKACMGVTVNPVAEVTDSNDAPEIEASIPEAPAAESTQPDLLPSSDAVLQNITEAATPVKDKSPEQASKSRKKSVKDNVRVDADRLDKLVDTIGELVIAQAMVHQSDEWSFNEGSQLPKTLNQMDKITRELQELAMSLRMVPIRPTFQKMGRLVRDVAKKLNKHVHFTTNGEETELDKSVVDAIGDPLVHMVRNAIDHGIESPEERIKAGKKGEGNVQLKAFHQGGSIYIEIVDDGKGLDKDAILKKGIERGIVRESDNLSDNEIYNLIFEAGFSTAAQITDVSGRGVGMDVVKKNIQALRGRVDIRSEKGKGSVFSIRLPLTLAIIEGMVVQVGEERYIFPTMSIVRMIRPEQAQLTSVLRRGELLQVGDQLIPIYHLSRIFKINGACENPCEAAVVIVENDGKQFAFVVDDLLGQQQIVIKPLGGTLKNTTGLSGGAIMPDGRVGLILDIAGLVKVTSQDGAPTPDSPESELASAA